MVEHLCEQKLSSEDISRITSGTGGSFGVLFGRIGTSQTIDVNGMSRVLFGTLDQRGNPAVREHRVFLTYESIEEALNSCGELPSLEFKRVWNTLQEKIERVAESFPETEKPRLIFYMSNTKQASLIDPEIMEGFSPEHKDYFRVDDSPRTEAEKQFYKAQILSKPDSNGSYEIISLEQAIDWCSHRAINYFGYKEFIEGKDDLAQEALIRAIPYLEGERGSFTDFLIFQRAFMVILKNLKNDMYRLKKVLKEDSLDLREEWDRGFLVDDRQVKENTGNRISEKLREAIAERLDVLSLKDREVLDLRLQKVPYAKLAEIYGENESALRVRVFRILDELNPQREKNKGRQLRRKPEAEMLSSYREFRNNFLTEKGRLPRGVDIDMGYKNGLIICRAPTYALRFAGCYSWEAARKILEQEISREQEAEVI